MVLCSVAMFMETFVLIHPAISTVPTATYYKVQNIYTACQWGSGIAILLRARVWNGVQFLSFVYRYL